MRYFFDFDGTMEMHDELAEEMMSHLGKDGCGTVTPFDGHVKSGNLQYTEQMLKDALDLVLAQKGGKQGFIDAYFDDGHGRLAAIQKGLDDLQKDKTNEVYILSASWRAIPGTTWAGYLKYLISDAKFGLGFKVKKANVIGIDDLGPGLKADKGQEVMNVCKKANPHCVHIDNSAAYIFQARSRGFAGYIVEEKKGVMAKTFEDLAKKSDSTCTVPFPYSKGYAYKPGTGWFKDSGSDHCADKFDKVSGNEKR